MSADAQQIAREVEEFVLRQSGLSGPLERDVDLFDAGLVDSIGIVELIAFLERRFEVEISDEFLLSPEFGTLEGLAGVVSQLGAAGDR
jgi:acyl carrier protein